LFARLRSRLRNIFIAGLLVTLPITITVYILAFLFRWVDSLFSPLVFRILQVPQNPTVVWLREHDIPGLGVVVTVALIFLVGLFTKNIVGRRLVASGEELVTRIPVARTIYAGAKQVLEIITSPGSKAFKQVVMVEFPRTGLYSLGFLTSEVKGEPQAKTGEEVLHVFVPTTPNPTSGFLLLVPKKEIIRLDMSVEDAVKVVVSGGVLAPSYPSKPAAVQTSSAEVAASDYSSETDVEV